MGTRATKGCVSKAERVLELCRGVLELCRGVVALEGGPRTPAPEGAAEGCEEEFKISLKLGCSLDDVVTLEGGPRTPAPEGSAEGCEEEFKSSLKLG